MTDRGGLTEIFDKAWCHLMRGVSDKRAPARYPTFATVSPDGRPEARTMVLRRAEREAAMLEVHSDHATSKMRALQHAPYAALHVWIPRVRLQIRMVAEVEIITGQAATGRCEQVPAGARVSYGTQPEPGTPIQDVDAYDTPVAFDRFAVLCCHLIEIDLLHLEEPHRRAKFTRVDGWDGTWTAP